MFVVAVSMAIVNYNFFFFFSLFPVEITRRFSVGVFFSLFIPFGFFTYIYIYFNLLACCRMVSLLNFALSRRNTTPFLLGSTFETKIDTKQKERKKEKRNVIEAIEIVQRPELEESRAAFWFCAGFNKYIYYTCIHTYTLRGPKERKEGSGPAMSAKAEHGSRIKTRGKISSARIPHCFASFLRFIIRLLVPNIFSAWKIVSGDRVSSSSLNTAKGRGDTKYEVIIVSSYLLSGRSQLDIIRFAARHQDRKSSQRYRSRIGG